MAREHARVLCSIWRPGDDFRTRSPEAQRLYFLLLSQRELNNAGVMPVMVNKWARCSAGTTTGDIEKALAELVDSRYVVVDWDTEELLVRTFIRNDGILKHRYTRRSALRSAEQIESRILRHALAAELVRIGDPEGIETASRLDPNAISTTHPEPMSTSAPTTHSDGIESTSSSTHPDGYSDAAPTTHGGRGGGRGGGKAPVPESSSRETREEPSPERPSERCKSHAGVDEPPPCGRCRTARLAAERWDGEQAHIEALERAARRALIEACGICDDVGMREFEGLGVGHCTHPDVEAGGAS